MPGDARNFLSVADQARILEAIREAEAQTSGEVRVHLELRARVDVLERAAALFRQLGMHRTRERNGVLFYLAIEDRKFAILGDEGIHAAVPEGFWDTISLEMGQAFREGRFADGLCQGILKAGSQLRRHFPHRKDDQDELNNEISFVE
ncbi:MAG TPA: TPM domain-containing protein [Bacteroidales bacterium]|nr:TPM domain-containing protein [Bacteroidales bacterium]HRZ78290.1 TPM domain-containing protein [Bacteroidales bacterium]